jgi:hypothetical protein
MKHKKGTDKNKGAKHPSKGKTYKPKGSCNK